MSLRTESVINLDLYQIRREEPSDGDGNMGDMNWIIEVYDHEDRFRYNSYCINIHGKEIEYENSECFDKYDGAEQWCLA